MGDWRIHSLLAVHLPRNVDHQGRVRRVWPRNCPQKVLLNGRLKPIVRLDLLQIYIFPTIRVLWLAFWGLSTVPLSTGRSDGLYSVFYCFDFETCTANLFVLCCIWFFLMCDVWIVINGFTAKK